MILYALRGLALFNPSAMKISFLMPPLPLSLRNTERAITNIKQVVTG